METLKEIERRLREGELTSQDPHGCAEAKAKLAGEYSFFAGRLAEIEVKKPREWLKLREEHDSDKATDRAWERTNDGVDEIYLSRSLKRIEKMMSALTTLISMAEFEKNLS